MSENSTNQATSTELSGGSGFTYSDIVTAYYLAALLREEHAAGQVGVVTSVAVEQAGHDQPMDDIIVEFEDGAGRCVLSLQAKRQLRISAAPSNTDFRGVMAAAVSTRASQGFQEDRDAYGFVTENVASTSFRALNRLVDWAKASPSGSEFERRFADGGAAAAYERELRQEIAPLTGAATADEQVRFLRHFVALQLDGLNEGGLLRAEVVNRLQQLVIENEDGQGILLFDRLCRIVRDGAGHGRKWTRSALLSQLRGIIRLRVVPNFAHDIDKLQTFSQEGLADVLETIDEFHVARPALQEKVNSRLAENRLVNISGLPGCGKSAVLKRNASAAAIRGPILFLKSDRLVGNSWSTFAATFGLRHSVAEILTELGAAGTPILFIDGIDRIRPDQKGIITDLLNAIQGSDSLSNWKVLATSRDQGLEAYRAWFPTRFYRGAGIGDVPVGPFTDAEAEALATEKPHMRRLLFGASAVKEIARRPFFAAVLARSRFSDEETPQTEIDLVAAWWARAGHDALPEAVPLRQRALLDLAEAGARTLGKHIPARMLKDSTFAQIAALKADLIIREQDGGASYSFAHDIFFEWPFFRLLIDLGADWHRALIQAGEPPLLGRVIGLLAQSSLPVPGKWTAGFRSLAAQPLRPQWRREWLTAPPFTPAFSDAQEEYGALLLEQDFALLEKLLVWFQAQHTVPSPIILQRVDNPVEGIDNVRAADLLGWPSDFLSWGRLLDWLIPLLPALPVRLLTHVLEVFSVWQNAVGDMKNFRSESIVNHCNGWLIEFEESEYADRSDQLSGGENKWRELGSEARSRFSSSLRATIIRSARAYPGPAIGLFDRAIANEDMRKAAYGDLVSFTPMMAEIAPEKVVELAEAELMEELPQERFDRSRQEERERREQRERLRAIPEAERTSQQRRALEHVPFPIGPDRYDLDDIGIDRHHDYYNFPSPLHEPFASLFAKSPAAALRLVRNLSNRAVTGWKQVHALNRRQMGTPVAVTVAFPWGEQQFWGDWYVYSWSQGQNAPQPLECAYLALSYWAFKELDRGRSASEVVQAIVEGSECHATLGLALLIALEASELSETTLPIVSCQRLWHHDLARFTQEPTKNLDLFGLGFLSRLTGLKAQAKEYLDQRESRARNVCQMAMVFALSGNESLRGRFKAALEGFPSDLPYELEEMRGNRSATAQLMEKSQEWAGLGDAKNYEESPAADNQVLIAYKSPVPMTPEREKKLASSENFLNAQGALGWATKSLSENKPRAGWTLAKAVAFAKSHDTDKMFNTRLDVGGHAAQSAVSAVAACQIRFEATEGGDLAWAWNVMSRIERMAEPERFPGSKIPWHPTNHLIVALVHDRRTTSPRADSVQRLLKLTAHPLEDVSQLAFTGLFMDADDHVSWVAAQLAMDLSIRRRISVGNRGKPDDSANQLARQQSFARVVANLESATATPLANVPSAWVRGSRRRSPGHGEGEGWHDPDPFFDAKFAARIFPLFPVEAWCRSSIYRPLLQATLSQLVTWTSERLRPSWWDGKTRRDSQTNQFEWNGKLGDLLARAAPFFEVQLVREQFLAPFLVIDDEVLRVLASFADRTVIRQVLDAPDVPSNTMALLGDCVERVVSEPMLRPGRYRAGEVYGHDMPTLITALLLVAVEKSAVSRRFANGDWSQISLIMPLVTRLVSTVGWSSYVMQQFLTLCERAGLAYPLNSFSGQANAILGSLANARGSWAGTTLASRLARIVQRLADGHYPLQAQQAQELLKILDALIDLGDRRSAALEQTEAFRGVQIPPSMKRSRSTSRAT